MKKIILALLILTCTLTAGAQDKSFWSGISYTLHLGLNLGGTAPLDMPASIRKLNSYTLQSNPAIGVTAEKPLSGRWGLQASLYYENKGMKEDANVKNYHMAIVRGGESLEGQYTGDEMTEVNQWMLTVPVEVVFHISQRVRVHAGPYVSWLAIKEFDGNAHDGYLRVGDPTGAKVEMGNDPTTWGSYDFGKDMRHWQWGMGAGLDWRTGRRFGLFAELKWGLSGIFHSDFHTVEQTLYPIFGTVGVSYRLK